MQQIKVMSSATATKQQFTTKFTPQINLFMYQFTDKFTDKLIM